MHAFPPFPMREMTRDEAIKSLRECRDMAVQFKRDQDPGFVRWPDLDDLLDYIDRNGFPPSPTV